MDDTISDIPSVELNMEQFEDLDVDDGGSGDESGGKCHLMKFGLCIDDNV